MRHKYRLRGAYIVVFFLLSFNAFSQVGIGNTDPSESSLLDIRSTPNDKGLLIPRISIPNLSNAAPVSTPVVSLLVYNTSTATGPGFFYWEGTRWVGISGGKEWKLRGNAGTVAGTDFLGTTDNINLILKTNNYNRFEITNGNQANGGRLRAFTNGTAAAPMYTWSTEPGTGMFQQAANVLGFSTGGIERLRIPNANQIHAVQTGTNALPSYSWSLDPNMGMWRAGANTLAFSTTSVERMRLLSNGQIVVNSPLPFGGVVFNSFALGSDDAIAGGALNGAGVYGQAEGSGIGVFGIVNHSVGFGMRASNLDWSGVAILAAGAGWPGSYLPTTGISAIGDEGIFSWGRLSTGTGVYGTGNNSTNIVGHIYGGGLAGSGTRNGVFGYAGNGNRNNANRGNAAGIFSLDTDNNVANNNQNNNNGTRATAILAGFDNIVPGDGSGAADSYFGGYFSGGLEKADGSGNRIGTVAYAYVGLRYNTNNFGTTGTDFKIVGPGLVSTLINDDQNVPRIMFAPEAPEILFQDYGIGYLVNGEATITLDPILKKSLHIDSQHPLKVFVTLEGDCNGVYVTNKSADGFTVRELQNGTSSVPFSWQIVANRADTKDRDGNVVSKHVGLRLPVGPGSITAKAKEMELKTDENKGALKERRESVSENVQGRVLSESAEAIDGSVGSYKQSQVINAEVPTPTKTIESANTKN